MARMEPKDGLKGYFTTKEETIADTMTKAERFENIEWLYDHGYIADKNGLLKYAIKGVHFPEPLCESTLPAEFARKKS